jgi:hypothetical protein
MKDSKLARALSYGFRDRKKASVTMVAAGFLYVSMVLLTFPSYSWQLLSANPLLLVEAVTELSWNLQASAGVLGLALTGIYAALGGIAVSIVVYGASNSGAGALGPGILVSGCASCGTGLLGLIGLSGALAALPFSGNLVRAGGIGLLLFFMSRTGNPEVCEAPEDS